MSRLKLAVIGVGALGRHHARILSEFSDVELVAVVDSRPEQGGDVAAKCGSKWLADYRPLLTPGAVDAVSVVVPTVAHWQVAGEFLRAGLPVLVEKPLAATVSQAQELVQLAADNKALLQVGHIERFNPAFQVASERIRQPKYIRAERTSAYTFRSTDIGAVHDLMIHDIDLVLSLVRSPLLSVEAFGVTVMGGHEDAVQARLRFVGGCIADLTASRISPTVSRSLQVWSGAGCVTCDLHLRDVKAYAPSDKLRFGPSPLDLARQPGCDMEQLKRDVFGQFVNAETLTVDATGPDALTKELRGFVDCVRTGQTPHVDGKQGLAAMLVADEVLKSVASHQWDGTAHGAIGPNPHVQAGSDRRAA